MQPFSLPSFMTYNMFIYNQIFSQKTFTLLSNHCPLHCLCERGVFSLCKGGGRIFSQGQRGGQKFFPVGELGDQIFFTYAKEGPEKIGNRPSQTDGPPPGRNDSSLTLYYILIKVDSFTTALGSICQSVSLFVSFCVPHCLRKDHILATNQCLKKESSHTQTQKKNRQTGGQMLPNALSLCGFVVDNYFDNKI